jgi:hypothetical protein
MITVEEINRIYKDVTGIDRRCVVSYHGVDGAFSTNHVRVVMTVRDFVGLDDMSHPVFEDRWTLNEVVMATEQERAEWSLERRYLALLFQEKVSDEMTATGAMDFSEEEGWEVGRNSITRG